MSICQQGPGKPRVWILVTLFNRAQNLPLLFNRLARQTYPDFRLVMIDHGTPSVCSERIPQFVDYVRSSPDKWWGGAINDGIRYVFGRPDTTEDDFILLQNDDVDFDEAFVGNLVRTSQDAGGAVVGALTVDQNSGLIMDANNYLSVWRARHICPFRGKPVESAGTKLLESDILKGRGVIYPVRVVQRIGLINEKLARRSDPEWAFRARRHGFRVVIDPRIVVKSTVDPRTLLSQVCTLADIRKHLFSPRSYSNLPDAWHYFRLCLDPCRAVYCSVVHTLFTLMCIVPEYLRGRVTGRRNRATIQQ